LSRFELNSQKLWYNRNIDFIVGVRHIGIGCLRGGGKIMEYKEEQLWKLFERKAAEEDIGLQHKYIAAVETVCDYGIDRARDIGGLTLARKR
jgi:hypothetical protein